VKFYLPCQNTPDIQHRIWIIRWSKKRYS